MPSFRIAAVAAVALLVAAPASFAFQPATTRTSSSSRTTTTTNTQLHAKSGPMKCRPIGIGSAAPKVTVTNVDLEEVVETSDDWIQTRTGIAQRKILNPTETLRDLAIQASQQALKMAEKEPSDIDMVICCTSSPDDMFGDAPTIASELGCSTDTVAFDLTAACSGFLFGTVTAGQFLTNIANSGAEKQTALVIGADALSRWVDWEDRNTCILFGDGAGAMVLESSTDDTGLLGYAAHSNGHGSCDLKLGYNGATHKVSTPGEGTLLTNGSYGKLFMNGREVYKFATREVPDVLMECLQAADMNVDDIDWLLLHQANIRIMETVAKKLDIPMDKVLTNLSSYGNTSAASIPLALDEAVRSGQVKKGDVIACAGFGAGLSWGATIFKWQ